MSKTAKQLNYGNNTFITNSPAEYRFSKLYPNTGSQSVTLATGATTPVTFELPSDAFNLSRAYLTYTITPTAVAGNVNISYKDLMSHINQIQLVTRNQVLIADIQNVPLYTKCMWKAEIKNEDFQKLEVFSHNNGYGSMICKNNGVSKMQIANTSTAVGANPVNQDDLIYDASKLSTYRVYPGLSANSNAANLALKYTLSSKVGTTYDGATAGKTASDQTPSNEFPYDEPQYFEISPTRATNGPAYNIKFPLSLLINSYFAVDRDSYFNGEVVYLKILFSSSTACNYISNLADTDIAIVGGVSSAPGALIQGHPSSDLVKDTAPTPLIPVYTIAATTATAAITNLTTWLPICRDPNVREKLKQKIDSKDGLHISTPFIWTMNTSFPSVAPVAGVFPSTTSQNVTLRLTASHGRRLQKIYYTLVNADGTGALSNLQYDISNLGYVGGTRAMIAGPISLTNGYKVQQFQTFLDSKPLQDYVIDCTNGDHFLLQKEYLRGSLLYNTNMLDYNFVWIERFDNLINPISRPISTEYDENNLITGIPLTNYELKYDFMSICNQYFALTHYAFVVTQRDLKISNEGITLDQN